MPFALLGVGPVQISKCGSHGYAVASTRTAGSPISIPHAPSSGGFICCSDPPMSSDTPFCFVVFSYYSHCLPHHSRLPSRCHLPCRRLPAIHLCRPSLAQPVRHSTR